jgi:hypothetical protein
VLPVLILLEFDDILDMPAIEFFGLVLDLADLFLRGSLLFAEPGPAASEGLEGPERDFRKDPYESGESVNIQHHN